MKRVLLVFFIFLSLFSITAQDNYNSTNEIDKEVDVLIRKRLKRISSPEEKPRRALEGGIRLEGALSNNYFSLSKYMVENLVIDLKKVQDELPTKGLFLDMACKGELFFNINFRTGSSLDLKAGLDGSGFLNFSKESFRLLTEGSDIGKTSTISGELQGSVFYSIGADLGFKKKGFTYHINPSLFCPLLLVETEECRLDFINLQTGTIKADAISRINMYTNVDGKSLFEDRNASGFMTTVLEGWGLDLAGSVQHPLSRNIDLKLYGQIPIIPGHLKNKTSFDITYHFHTENMMDFLQNTKNGTNEGEVGEKTYSSSTIYINRPMRLGVEGLFNPFGRFMKFTALLGMGVYRPFSEKYETYPEYDTSMRMNLYNGNWNWMSMEFHTAYLKQIFIHSMLYEFNFHFFEMDLGLSSQGRYFPSSLEGSGVGFIIQFVFGF